MSEQFLPSDAMNDRQATGNTQDKKSAVVHDVGEDLSSRQYRLPLRGNSLNPMIDAATPLLGMVMRVDGMNSQSMPEHLFAQVVTDVQAVEQLLQEQGYEPGVIVSFRYVLCTFIDEAALGNGWSNKNEWIKQSLLVHFHNEAWGGEKIFILLERLIREPKRYQDLLEFIFLCFSLGFRGRYKVAVQDQGNLIRSTAACTTSCIPCAAMHRFRYCIRIRKHRAGAIN